MALSIIGHSTLKNPEKHKLILKAKSIEDLKNANISLGNKLSFLGDSGLTCFKKYVDKELRNNITHMDFEIADDGGFFVYRNGMHKEEVSIQQEWRKLAILNSHLVKSKVDLNKEVQREWGNQST